MISELALISLSLLVFHHVWGKEIRGRLHVMVVNRISQLASVIMARMGGCQYAALQGMKEALKTKKDQECSVCCLAAVEEGLAKRVCGSGWQTWRVTLATVTYVLTERRLEDSE